MIVSIPLTLFASGFSDILCVDLPIFSAQVCSIAFIAPFIEEFSKAFPLFYRHAETERSIFTLGFLVGLGFGIVEFVEYIVLLGAPIVERLPLIFFHASVTSIVAFGISRKRTVYFYFVAVVLHLSNNLLAFFPILWLSGGFLIIVLAYYLSWYLYRRTAERMIPF